MRAFGKHKRDAQRLPVGASFDPQRASLVSVLPPPPPLPLQPPSDSSVGALAAAKLPLVAPQTRTLELAQSSPAEGARSLNGALAQSGNAVAVGPAAWPQPNGTVAPLGFCGVPHRLPPPLALRPDRAPTPTRAEAAAVDNHPLPLGDAGSLGSEVPQQSNHGPRLVRLVLDTPAGRPCVICPFLPFRIESAFTISIARVQGGAGGVANGVNEVWGGWRRPKAGAVCRDLPEMPVRLSLSVAGDGGLRVVSAQGPGRFRRCAVEHWEVATIGGMPPAMASASALAGTHWAAQLRPGAALVLRRPHRRALVLRKPEQQTSRLLIQIARTQGSLLLAAPTGSGAAVAVLTVPPVAEGAEQQWTTGVSGNGDAGAVRAVPRGAAIPSLVPQSVRDELEERFGVVLAEEADAAEVTTPSNVAEVTLQRLLAAGAVACLRAKGWASVEEPSRLIPSSYLTEGMAAAGGDGESAQIGGRRKPLPAATRVPCVDVACRRAVAETPNRLVADIEITPSVRRAQPVATHLARGLHVPELLGPFVQNSSRTMPVRPRVRVLPQMTEAEVVNIFPKGLPPAPQLPEDLRTVDDFSTYWRFVHGFELAPTKLFSGGFATVVFPKADFGPLTYPLACLWRHAWVEQPMMTRKLAPKIVAMAADCLLKVNLLGGRQQVRSLPEATVEPRGPSHRSPMPLAAGACSGPPPPRLLPASRAVPSTCGAGQARLVVSTPSPPRDRVGAPVGKRRLLLPLLRPSAGQTLSASPAKRARRRGDAVVPGGARGETAWHPQDQMGP